MENSEDSGNPNSKSERAAKSLKIRKCKYCSLRFNNNTNKKLYLRHIKSHEKKYFKHWFKKKKVQVNDDAEEEHRGEKSEEQMSIGNSELDKVIGNSNCDRNISEIVENFCVEEHQEDSTKNVSENQSDGKNVSFQREETNEINNSENHLTDISLDKLESKQVYVYVVFAPQGVCSCEPSDLSGIPCDCKLEYKKFAFDSIESFHDASMDQVTYKCPKCHKEVLADKLKGERSKVKCQKCGDNFVNADKLTDHQQKCYGFLSNFQCLQCSFETSSQDQMMKHTSTHSTKVGHTKTTNRDPRKRLLASTRKQTNNDYVCPICGNRFKDGGQLRKHVLQHQQKRMKDKSVASNHSMRKKNGHFAKQYEDDDDDDDDYDDDVYVDDDGGSNYSDEDVEIKPSRKLKSGMSLRPRRQTAKMYVEAGDLDEDAAVDFYEEKRKDPSIGDLQFKCNFCERAFQLASLLQTHKQAMHSGKSPYVCLECLKRFQRQSDFTKHGQTHKGTIFKCISCPASFKKMELLHNHEYIHTEVKPINKKAYPFNCTVCNATFPNARSLSRHFKTHSLWDADGDLQEESEEDIEVEPLEVEPPSKKVKSNTYVCPICKALFKTGNELKAHSKTHEAERYKCKQCGLLCSSRLDLLNHAERHKHKCQFCELTFVTLAACKKHEKTHAPKKPSVFKCSFCTKEFKFKNDHQIHESLHKQYDGKRPEPKKYKCKYCGKGLSYKSDLKIHEELHETRTQENPNEYSCKHCDRKFDDKQAYYRHRHNHFRDKLPEPTKCPDCDQIFRYGSMLKEHSKKHWPEKPFVCVYCKARFKSKPELDDHEVIHLSGKRHPCHLCNRRFTTKKNLRVHMRLHTGEKPYVCSFCPNRFAQISLRRRHERIHTGECPYVCEICDRAFPYDSSLKVHYNSHKKKGIQVPEKCAMARGIRRQNAAYRKPPSTITQRKDPVPISDLQQKMLEKKVAAAAVANAAGPSSGVPKVPSVKRQTTTQRRRKVSPPPTQVPLMIPRSPQRHDSNMAQINNPNPNAPIQVTIQPTPIPVQLSIQQGEPMESGAPDPHQSVVQGIIQRQQEDLQETSWDALHSRYIQQTQNWQPSHNWQQLGQQLPGGSNWDMQSGNWGGPVPPPAHQGHSGVQHSSVITSALYGILPRDSDAHRGYQQ